MKINSEKQEPHMESTRLEGKSYLFDTENPQELLEKYSGTGRIELTFNGDRTNKENIDVGRYVGIDYRSKEKVTGIRIHHSKKTYAYSSMATAEGG
ncbi:polymorphic toxin type 50 domain-containing protein [Limosilactobacillus equigenerosi]|uniref:polymorphic toxin type 50 domain-containing protein n=1 Tax=Limosilactobacillus equigenerosi TaxID=417373 RepID=UPI003F71C22E